MWAVGLILYEIITGSYLFDSLRILTKYDFIAKIQNIKSENINIKSSSISPLC